MHLGHSKHVSSTNLSKFNWRMQFELDSTVICQCLQKYSRICFSLTILASQVNDSGVPALIYNYINYSAGCFVI